MPQALPQCFLNSRRSHLNFVLAEKGVDPLREGFLLDVEAFVSQSPDSTFLEIEVVLVRLPVRVHLAGIRIAAVTVLSRSDSAARLISETHRTTQQNLSSCDSR